MAGMDLDLATPDTHGQVPNFALVGTRMTNAGNGKVYVISGFVWIVESDEWGFVYYQEEYPQVSLTLPLAMLFSLMANGQPRFGAPPLGLDK